MKPILTAFLWMAIACLWVQPAFPAATETQVGKTVDISASSATALLRAKTTPGVIRVKAYVPGLKSGDARVVSRPPLLPLYFDATYAAASKPPATGGQVIILQNSGNQSIDVKQLQQQVQLLQRQLTSKIAK